MESFNVRLHTSHCPSIVALDIEEDSRRTQDLLDLYQMSHFVQFESCLHSYSNQELHELVMIELVLDDHPVL